MYKFKKPRIAKEITIINVFPNSPAWNVGIRTADRILKVNDIDVSDKALVATSLGVEPKDLFEFYYLQETADLKTDIISMLDKLNQDELSLAHKYVRTFLIK